MAEEKRGLALYSDFLARRGIKHDGQYRYLPRDDYKFVTVEKACFVTIGGEKVYVSPIVTNSRHLQETVVRGWRNADEAVDQVLQQSLQRKLDFAGMQRACQELMFPGLFLCLESLHFVAEKMNLPAEYFELLAQEVDGSYPALIRGSDDAYDSYCKVVEMIDREAQRQHEALDRRTAGIIANGPKTVHIHGYEYEGLFSDSFYGTAHVSSAIPQSEVIQAYIGNESTARNVREKGVAQAQEKVLKYWHEAIKKELKRFCDSFLLTIAKNHPKNTLSANALISSKPRFRPYTKKNILALLSQLEGKEEYFKLAAIIREYDFDFNGTIGQDICDSVLHEYKITGRYDYPYDDIDFLLYLNKAQMACYLPIMNQTFLNYFAGEIKARTEKWLADPSYRLPAGATVDDLFSDILNEADECAMLRSTWEEDEFLRAEGEKCLAKLRQKGQ